MASRNTLVVQLDPEQMALIEALNQRISDLTDRVEKLERSERMHTAGLSSQLMKVQKGL